MSWQMWTTLRGKSDQWSSSSNIKSLYYHIQTLYEPACDNIKEFILLHSDCGRKLGEPPEMTA